MWSTSFSMYRKRIEPLQKNIEKTKPLMNGKCSRIKGSCYHVGNIDKSTLRSACPAWQACVQRNRRFRYAHVCLRTITAGSMRPAIVIDAVIKAEKCEKTIKKSEKCVKTELKSSEKCVDLLFCIVFFNIALGGVSRQCPAKGCSRQ